MNRSLTTLFLVLFALSLFAQNDPRIARLKTPLSKVAQVTLPEQDNPALLETEMARRAADPAVAPKFAEVIPVEISPATHGDWELTGNGNAVWRLRIFSKSAKSLNLGFTKYVMPQGGSLILYSPDFQHIQGPFTPSDNEEHEQLWTPVLSGEEMVLEVQIPQRAIPDLRLELKYVNHDFIGFPALLASQQSTIDNQQLSGACNLDVACSAADGWAIVDNYRDIIQSVAVIQIGGSLQCTGFLVNNARQDCTPYFMTANHCGLGAGNAATLVAFWNFQNSTCRQPNSPASGGNGNGTLNDFNTGSIFKAGWEDSDFTLVELDDPVSENAEAFYAGWNAENVAPADTVIVIHHPNTDEKRISFEFDPTFVGNQNGTASPSGNYVVVPDYDVGTTEPGSSGAPIFNRKKQIVGQLWGGDALCGNDLDDSYGWFHRSWTGGGTPTTRLKDWLDPDDTGILELGGRSQFQCDLFVEANPASISVCAPAEAVFNIEVSENFTDSVALSLIDLPAGLVTTFAQNPIQPGGTTILVITGVSNLPDSTYIFQLFGTDSLMSNSSELVLTIASQPPVVSLISPENGAEGVAFQPVFSWETRPGETFEIQIATDSGFGNLIETATNLPNGTYQATTELAALTQYFWRVRGTNACGEGDWLEVRDFKTGVVFCLSHASADVPQPISANGTPVVASTLLVPAGGFISDVNVLGIKITHSWVSDLRISLTSPSGTEVELMTNIQGNCEEDNLDLAFDDEAATPSEVLQTTCNPTPPAASGLFQPFQSLGAFKGEPAVGTWTLRVFDDANQDGGSLDGWGLEICSTVPHDFSVIPLVSQVTSCVNEAVSFNLMLGGAFDDSPGVTLSASNLPPGATTTFSQNPAAPGTLVQVTLSGATMAGIFTPQITASDGTVTQTVEIQWKVLGTPASP
ncbi:MAG: proprotein convertase P-domain-containing protein, partial [Bacteroidota bacterium]